MLFKELAGGEWMWLGIYVSRWPQSIQSSCCAARATRGYKERITRKNRTAHQSDDQTRRCHWLRGSTSWIRLHTTPMHVARPPRGVWTRTTCKDAQACTRKTSTSGINGLEAALSWWEEVGSSQWTKALQSPVREYIKVIFVVLEELVYQRGDCFIFAEVCVHIGVSERARFVLACMLPCVCACVRAFAWMCLCVLVPTDPSRLTTELSGSAFHFKCYSYSKSLAGPHESSQVLTSLHCIVFLSMCMLVCM